VIKARECSVCSELVSYLTSPSTLIGATAGLIIYFPCAVANQHWLNPILFSMSVLVTISMPYYAKLINTVEEFINLKTANITVGRISRFAFQLVTNILVLGLLASGSIFSEKSLFYTYGLWKSSIFLTMFSQGVQYVFLILTNRGIGNKNRNTLYALVLNSMGIAIVNIAILEFRNVFLLITLLGLLPFVIVSGVGIISDVRSYFYPKRGFGIFFGTFNPFHKTHLEIIGNAIRDRNLQKVIVHPTVIPKLHAEALRKGEITVDHREHGMRVYQKTDKADANVNYFPTGNKFYEHTTRELLIKLAIEEAGMKNTVEVWSLPEIYLHKGFYGVIAEIRQRCKGVPLHGIHGSDVGGMWTRNIYDESGWIYPYPVKRVNSVSATAIRNGAKGMTPHIVEEIIKHLRNNESSFEVYGRQFAVHDGELHYEKVSQECESKRSSGIGT
jgi:Cytidylyltransferase-like